MQGAYWLEMQGKKPSAIHAVNYKQPDVVLINNTANMTNEKAAWTVSLARCSPAHSEAHFRKWISAKTLQATKAERNVVPATVPTQI